MVIVVLLAQTPAVGVKVYSVVALLSTLGDQIPVIALVEVVGKTAKAAPEQIAATCVNVGVVFGVTTIVIVVLFAQTPTAGVKVYNVVAKLVTAGDHVPVIALVEVVGKAANVAPEQTAATCMKVGVILGVTAMVIVVLVAH